MLSPTDLSGAAARNAPTPLTSEDVRQWWARIELDRQTRKRYSDGWKRLLQNYLPPPIDPGNVEDINSNIHFRNVHLKIAEVWAQFPELKLTPLAPLSGVIDPQTGQPLSPDTIVAIKRAVLMKLLGRDFANVNLTIIEVLFDIFATSGVGFTKICYQSDIQITKEQIPGPPQPMEGAVLGLQEVPGPVQTVEVPVVVNEKLRWYRFSPEKALIPADWHSTDYDAAPYLAMEFSERNTPAARKRYRLPEDFKGTASRDERLLSNEKQDVGGNLDLIQGVEIWLHAADYDPAVANTDIFYRLVLIEGVKDRAAVYEFSPYQDLDEQGRLTTDSLIGNPIHPMTLRVASDMAWIPSDAAFTNPLVVLENTWVSQDVALREANIPRFLHAVGISEAIDKLKEAGNGQGIAIPDDQMMRGMDHLIAALPHLERAQSDTQGRQQIQRAITETLGLGSNQGGGFNDHGVTATEVATIQANISVRLKGEQNILMGRILQGVRKFDALVQRYMDQQDYVQIVGADGATQLVAYTQAHLAGRYAYDAFIDTQLTQDQGSRIKRATDFVNFMAKSPVMDQAAMARLTTTEFGYDPALLIKPPPPPPPPPRPEPSISMALKAADLAIPEVRAVLQYLGIPMQAQPSAEALMARELDLKVPVHGGASDKADLVNKHQADLSGQQVGQPPMAGQPAHPVAPEQMVQ